LKLNKINALIKLEGAFNLQVVVEEIKGSFTSEVFNLEQAWARSLNDDKLMTRYDSRSWYRQYDMKTAILKKKYCLNFNTKVINFLFFECEQSSNRKISNYDCLYGNYNFPNNINLTLIYTHKSQFK
jgi:hypothetical protein